MSPAKHSYVSVTDGQTDRRTDGQTTGKVIPMCRYASQATQKAFFVRDADNFDKSQIKYKHRPGAIEFMVFFCSFYFRGGGQGLSFWFGQK